MTTTNANTVSRFWASQNTPFGSQGTELSEPNIYIWCFSLKAVYNSCKLKRLLRVAKFLFMYPFTRTNIVFLFRHLPTEIFIFINVYFQMNCFSGDSFSFFWEYSTYFFDFMWSSNKVFKDVVMFWTVHSRPFIRY